MSLLEIREAFADGEKHKDFYCEHYRREGDRSYERAQGNTVKLLRFRKRLPESFFHGSSLMSSSHDVSFRT